MGAAHSHNRAGDEGCDGDVQHLRPDETAGELEEGTHELDDVVEADQRRAARAAREDTAERQHPQHARNGEELLLGQHLLLFRLVRFSS